MRVHCANHRMPSAYGPISPISLKTTDTRHCSAPRAYKKARVGLLAIGSFSAPALVDALALALIYTDPLALIDALALAFILRLDHWLHRSLA